MKKYRIHLNNAQLQTNPIGLNDIGYKFERDNGLFGLFVVTVLNLTFVGDGFCILKEFQDTGTGECSAPIKIEISCDGSTYQTIFNGNIPIAKIKINNSEKSANVEIEDNNPLALISQNSEIDFDYNSSNDIFGEPLKQVGSPYSTIEMFDEIGNYDYPDVQGISIKNAIEFIMNFMTGYEIQFESDFLNNTQPVLEKWRLTFVGEPGINQDTTIVYTNFYNQTITINAVSSGDAHIQELANRMVTPVTSIPSIPPEIRDFFRTWDQINFQDTNIFLSGNHFVEWVTPIPFKINSASTIGTAPIFLLEKAQDLVDAAYGIHFIDWNGLHELPGQMKLSFKQLITEINKATGCTFFVFLNPVTQILHVRLEDDNWFLNNSFTKTYDNIKEYSTTVNTSSTFANIEVGSKQSQKSSTNINQTFSSLYCGLTNKFDANNDFITDTVQIWSDLAVVFDPDDNNSDIYMVQVDNGQAIQYVIDIALNGVTSVGELTFYNNYLNNNMSILRHMAKFRNDLYGSPDKRITNIAQEKIFKEYRFTTYIKLTEFNEFIDSVPDRVRFKMLEETEYKIGIVKEINYNYNNGEAKFVVLGQYLATTYHFAQLILKESFMKKVTWWREACQWIYLKYQWWVEPIQCQRFLVVLMVVNTLLYLLSKMANWLLLNHI